MKTSINDKTLKTKLSPAVLPRSKVFLGAQVILISCLVFFSSLRAEDIDIYNTNRALPYPPYESAGNVAPPNPNYSNILFILDASWSMKNGDPGQIGPRIDRMRSAMEAVLTSSKEVNVAIMRFSHHKSGGRVIYPMSPIEYARDDMIDMINNLSLDWWTPTIGAMLEGAYYFRGEPVYYGLTRTNDIGHVRHRAEHLTRLSHPESYTGGTIVRHSQCTEANLDHTSCITERIEDNPVYRTPIHSGCQKNTMVLLTDGAATKRVNRSKVEDLIGRSCTSNGSNTCGVEIADFLATNDQAGIPGDSRVVTHTIGFNTSQVALEQIAAAGGGQYYESNSTEELVLALSNIINGARISTATLAQPAVSVDSSNRLKHRKDIYLTLFEPVLRPIWPGNLKGYWLDDKLQDYSTPRKAAIDTTTGKFAEDAKSRWSTTPDGSRVAAGGAASKIKPANSRTIVTNHPNGTGSLLDANNQFNSSNIDAETLGLPDLSLSITTQDLASIISWVRGSDQLDINKNGNLTEPRKQYGDLLHTNPMVVTYDKTADDVYDSVVYFGSNEGFIHAVETQTGEDLYSFIPWSLMGNLKHSYVNRPYGEKLYGMDGYLSSWFEDKNGDGIVDSANEHYFLYAGMRRGGRNYYALDITKKAVPELLWSIKGGEGEFTELGQSWSKMVHGRMPHPITGTVTDVLVFSGGYDNSQDDTMDLLPHQMGRAIYIVNASTGDLIWNAGPVNASLVLPEMKYSIPATPSIVDVDGDGLFDQIYAGDTGGQLWRFDVRDNGVISGGMIASLSSEATGNKPFFASPDVSLIKPTNQNTKLVVSIGSGSRPHPTDISQNNGFYVITQSDVLHAPEGYGLKDEDGIYQPLKHADLVDLTDNKIIEGTAGEKAQISEDLASEQGWFIRMEGIGEKIINPAITVDYKVVFTSYTPGEVSECAIGLGSNKLYVLNILDGTPASDQDADGILRKNERHTELNTPGISAAPSVVFSSDNEAVEVMVGTELGQTVQVDLVRRAYWSEVPDF